MLISKLFPPDNMDGLEGKHSEECIEHQELRERLRKTLYFGKTPKMDRPSMPMTELAVEFLQGATPKQLGKVKMDWASSVSRRASVSPCSMMLGMLYVERLRHKNPDYLQTISSEDLFLISMMVASKYLYDEGISEEVYNDEWADSADIDLEDINDLEREFLSAMDWNLYVKAEDFWSKLLLLEQSVCSNEGQKNGFFTYSDLHVLSDSDRFIQLVQHALLQICQVACVCSIAYAAGIATLALSPVALSATKSCVSHAALSLPTPALPAWTSTLTRPFSRSTQRSATVIHGQSDDSHTNETDLRRIESSSPQGPAPLVLDNDDFHGRETDLEGDASSPLHLVTNPVEHSGLSKDKHVDQRSSIPAWLHLSGFLTLSLIKDTVTDYVMSSEDQSETILLLHERVCCAPDMSDKNASDCGKTQVTYSTLPTYPLVSEVSELSTIVSLSLFQPPAPFYVPCGPLDRLHDH